MRKILAVVRREYIQIVRTKGFIIGTILGPVVIGLFILVPMAVSMMSIEKQETIGIIDVQGDVFNELDEKLSMKLKDGRRRFVLERFRDGDDLESLKEALNQKVMQEELSGYIFIPEDIDTGGQAEYIAKHVSDFDKIRSLQEALNSVVVAKRLETAGLDPGEVSAYMQRVNFSTKKVTERGLEEETGGTFLISYILVLILYMTLLLYGQIILRGVIEEKSSRVVEIVLSSLRPFQLMAGKILGIAAVGLTQYAIWVLFGLGLTRFSGTLMAGIFPQAQGFSLPRIPPYVFIYFVVFFLLGYFLYATLYAAIGSLVNSEKEAQHLVGPVTMALVIPILLMIFVMRSPDSTLSVVLSLIPFFSPILMLMRVATLLPPFIEIFASIVLMCLTILFMIWLTSKIYRVGLLMTGKRPGLREIAKWVRYR
ncbi:MAG: ABC transporter permease [Candidatus Aminicenantes bacterium]